MSNALKGDSYFLIFFLSIFCTFQGHAQPTSNIDLGNVIKLLNKANRLSTDGKYDSVILISTKVIEESIKLNYKIGEITALDILAEAMFKTGQINNVEKYNNPLLQYAINFKDTTLLINAKLRSGLVLLEKGKNKEAEVIFLTALNISPKKSIKTAEINSNLGTLYLALGDKEKALQYFFLALDLYSTNAHAKGLGETYSNISSVYYLSNKIDDAIAYQQKSINVRESANDKNGLVITNINLGQLYILKGNVDLSLPFIKQAVLYAEQLKNSKLMASSYAAMSVYFNRKKLFNEALIWQSKAIKLFEENDDKQMLSRLYVSAGNLANASNDSLLAVSYFNKALLLATNLNNKENISNVYDKLSSFYISRKDYTNAYFNYNKFILYKDSISAKSNLAKIEEIKTQYETEKKDNEIIKLNTLQRLKELQIEKQNALIDGNILLAKKKEAEIEALSQASIVLTQKSELQDLKLQQQNEQLDKQILIAKNNQQLLLLKEKEQVITEREITNQKKIKNLLLAGLALVLGLSFLFINRYQLKKKLEQQSALLSIRNNISQDLHDEIGSTLTSINILSSVSEQIVKEQPAKVEEMLHQIATQSKTIQQNMSDIVWSIRPENEKIENLIIRMREYAAQTLEPLNISLVITADDTLESNKLPIQVRKELLLIYKEAISNICKHSGANNVDIKFQKVNKELKFTIIDNGVWKGNTSGTGTKSMQNRANAIGGNLTIVNNEMGTQLVTIVPIP